MRNRYLFIFILLLLFMNGGCSKRSEPVRPIKHMVIETSSDAIKKSYSGVSQAYTKSVLSFRVPGNIEKRNVNLGDRVKEGDVLAELDRTDYKTKLNKAKAQFIAAEADIERYRSLYEEESATKQELDQKESSYEVAKSELELAKKNLDYTLLTAPADGMISKVSAEVFETVQTGQAICTLDEINKFKINVGLPTSLIGKVKKGDDVIVIFDEIKNEKFSGIINEIGVDIDPKTATFPITINMVKDDKRFRGGMVAEVVFNFKLPAKEQDDRIIVPAYTVLEDQNGERYVWLYDKKESRVYKHKVVVGDISEAGMEIKSGLKNDDIIATAGIHYLFNGQKVKLLD